MNNIKFYSHLNYRDWLVSIAIGEKYLEKFEKYVLPLVKEYCRINKLGLACITSDIDQNILKQSKAKENLAKVFSTFRNIKIFFNSKKYMLFRLRYFV